MLLRVKKKEGGIDKNFWDVIKRGAKIRALNRHVTG
jgi:hypothetical protein